MTRLRHLCCNAFLGLAVMLVVTDALAGVRVHPLRLSMQDGERVVEMQVRNIRSTDSVLQVRVMRWQQDARGKMVLSPAPELVVSPPAFVLSPDARQLVRIGRRSVEPLQIERAYRVVIEEIPEDRAAGGGLQMLMRVRLPLFVTPDHTTAALQFSARADCLWLSNTGSRRARLTDMAVRSQDGPWQAFEPSKLSYVLPGAAYCLDWPAGSGPPQRLRFETRHAGGGMRVLD